MLNRRLRRHHLAAHDGPVAVVRRLVGVQARVPSSARQAVAVRGPAAAAVETALTDRTLIRTWAARGTLHLLPADTAAEVLALVAAARTWEKPSWQREFATAAQIEALAAAATEILDDAVVAREELAAALGHVVDPAWLSSGWGAVLKPLAWQGVLCHGPPRGTRTTFTAPRTWVPGWTGLPDVDAAAPRGDPGLARRPRTGHRGRVRRLAPARVHPEARAAEVGRGDCSPTARSPRSTSRARRSSPGPPTSTISSPPARVDGVRLLPAFDQWVLAAGTRDPHVVPPAHRADVSRAAGWIAPVVLLDGVVAGTWAPAPEDGPGELRVAPFPGVPPLGPEGLDAERDRWRAILTAPVSTTRGAVLLSRPRP